MSKLVTCCTPIAILLFLSTVSGLQAQEVDFAEFNPAQCEQYEKQLNAILKTRRDEEKKFVKEVVACVKLGKIPSRLVSTSFQWVRNKRPNTKYPFVYFERVLRLQAKKLRLEENVPAFDYRIYSQSSTRTRSTRTTR